VSSPYATLHAAITDVQFQLLFPSQKVPSLILITIIGNTSMHDGGPHSNGTEHSSLLGSCKLSIGKYLPIDNCLLKDLTIKLILCNIRKDLNLQTLLYLR
jgi:hypothetical protein